MLNPPIIPPIGDECTGCAACAANCPQDAIIMQPDAEGFNYPLRDPSLCTECHQCTSVCPITIHREPATDSPVESTAPNSIEVFAAWHLQKDIRLNSSSGGVFSALAESILSKGGLVVGAAFDNSFRVSHIAINNPPDLHKLRGSKYVQSNIPSSLFRQIKLWLNSEKPVLFSGTPCQVAAIRHFAHNSNKLLYCCDILCHGVPSPLFWEKYVESQSRPKPLSNISFRDKTIGWREYSLRLEYSDSARKVVKSAEYLAAFLRNYALRPCCYKCSFANASRQGDITLGDFWGVKSRYPEFDKDNIGTSLVIINTAKAKELFEECRPKLFVGIADIHTAINGNPILVRPSRRPPQRDSFLLDAVRTPCKSLFRKYNLYLPGLSDRFLFKPLRKISRIVIRTLHNRIYLLEKKL